MISIKKRFKIPKDRQRNGQKMYERTNNYLHKTTVKTTYWTTRSPLVTRSALRRPEEIPVPVSLVASDMQRLCLIYSIFMQAYTSKRNRSLLFFVNYCLLLPISEYPESKDRLISNKKKKSVFVSCYFVTIWNYMIS